MIFYFLNSLNSLFAEDIYVSTKSAFLYIRFPLFVIASIYLLKKYPKLIIYFYYITLVTVCFVSVDAIIQFFTGDNLFGFTSDSRNRVSGLFRDEFILGSYLARITPILISILIFFKKDLSIRLFSFVFLIVFLGIIVSGERTSLLLISAYCIIFITFILKSTIRIKVTLVAALITIIVVTSLSSNNLRERYVKLSIDEIQGNIENLPEEENVIGGQRLKHIYVSLEMFKQKPFFGHGNKMFARVCFDQFFVNDGRCSTHPHVIIMQILVENGIIGVFTYLILSIILFIKFIIAVRNNNDHISAILLIILINFCPFIPSGALYNNQISIFMYLPFIIYFFYNGDGEKILYEKKD